MLDSIAIDHLLINLSVKKGPANCHKQYQYKREEKPAVNDMIKPSRKIRARMVCDIDCAKCPDSVGENGQDNCSNHEQNAPRPTSKTDIANQCPESDHSNQKLYAGTGLLYCEIA